MTGIELIAQERAEQLEKHNRTIWEDVKKNDNYHLARGAVALINGDRKGFSPYWDRKTCQHMIDKSYRDRLIIAGALIAAEIDRIQFIHV